MTSSNRHVSFSTNTLRCCIFICLAATLLGSAWGRTQTMEKLVDRLSTAEWVLEHIMENEETRIPAAVLQQARGMAIVHQWRGGFMLGGQGGSAILVARNPVTNEWGPPGFLQAGGISFGLQAGVKELSAIYVFMTDESLAKAYSGRFNLGADASAIAGPVGPRDDTTVWFEAPVLVYSGVRGLFAGLSVKGGWTAPEPSANRLMYHRQRSLPEIILSDWFPIPEEARPLINRIRFYESE